MLIKTNGISIVFVGLSMGGYVSLSFCRDYPDSVLAMVLVGSEDTLTPPAEAESLRNSIKGARLRNIEGAGHLSNMEQPEEFNAAIVELIESIKQAV